MSSVVQLGLPSTSAEWKFQASFEDTGTFRRVRMRAVAQGTVIEECPNCHRGKAHFIGRLIHSIFEAHLVYEIYDCDRCCVYTVLTYPVDVDLSAWKEETDCHG